MTWLKSVPPVPEERAACQHQESPRVMFTIGHQDEEGTHSGYLKGCECVGDPDELLDLLADEVAALLKSARGGLGETP